MDSDIPLYAQLVVIIKRNISTGALASFLYMQAKTQSGQVEF